MNSKRRRRTLDRHLSRAGVASRTEAEKLIRDGKVTVNGNVVRDPRSWIHTERDDVTVRGQKVAAPSRVRVIVYNKKRGLLVTARDPEGRDTVYDALPEPFNRDRSLRPVGRLDKATGGLLLFTNDTDLAAHLLDHDQGIPRTYRVKLSPPPSERNLGHLRSGVNIGDRRRTLPARVTMERKNPRSAVIRMILTEGRNRQIRRMAERIECRVEWLIRTHFGPIELGNLEPGEAREATPEELEAIVALTG